MSDEWFDEYVYEVVVEKKYLEGLKVVGDVIKVPIWNRKI